MMPPGRLLARPCPARGSSSGSPVRLVPALTEPAARRDTPRPPMHRRITAPPVLGEADRARRMGQDRATAPLRAAGAGLGWWRCRRRCRAASREVQRRVGRGVRPAALTQRIRLRRAGLLLPPTAPILPARSRRWRAMAASPPLGRRREFARRQRRRLRRGRRRATPTTIRRDRAALAGIPAHPRPGVPVQCLRAGSAASTSRPSWGCCGWSRVSGAAR